MSDINVISRTQRIIVDMASGTVSVINAGPQGPAGPQGALPDEQQYTVGGGTGGTQPTFSGSPLFTGHYVLLNDLVHFQVEVVMTNITSFGSGQYYVTIPFVSKYPILVRNGCLHDASSGKEYGIAGHVDAGSNQMWLTYTGSNGQDEPFEHNSPITLTTADNFHISGTYIR